MVGEKERARKAWERSIAVVRRLLSFVRREAQADLSGYSTQNPSYSTTPTLLLGLSHLNASKDPTLAGGEDARAQAYKEGIEGISAAFKRDNTLAAATAPLAGHFLLTGKAGVSRPILSAPHSGDGADPSPFALPLIRPSSSPSARSNSPIPVSSSQKAISPSLVPSTLREKRRACPSTSCRPTPTPIS